MIEKAGAGPLRPPIHHEECLYPKGDDELCSCTLLRTRDLERRTERAEKRADELENKLRERSLAGPLYEEHGVLATKMFTSAGITHEERERLNEVRRQLDEIETRRGEHWVRLRDRLEHWKARAEKAEAEVARLLGLISRYTDEADELHACFGLEMAPASYVDAYMALYRLRTNEALTEEKKNG